MSDRLLKQEEIDALLNAQIFEPVQPETDAGHPAGGPGGGAGGEQSGSGETGAGPAEEAEELDAAEFDLLSGEEKDALGEVGNICMGSAATTLSMLLNQKVNITSPEVSVTTLEELFKGFVIPHMTIYVRFTEGLSGYNLLIMKLQDAAVLADLMMGGDGTTVSEELTEIGISAASEAMNQMIGSASTSMAAMFGRTVNISPPETKIYHSADELKPPELVQGGPVVVVWFKMTVGEILDTQIMQVMSVDTAREEAGMILGQLSVAGGEGQPAFSEGSPYGELPEGREDTGMPEPGEEAAGSLRQDLPGPEPVQTAGPPAAGLQARTRDEVRPPAAGRPAVAAPPGIDQQRLNMILDIPLKVTVLLGRTRWPIKDILGLSPGSVIELQSLVDEPVEVLVNGTLVAMGEVVVVNENFGVRITSIIGPEERLQNLRK